MKASDLVVMNRKDRADVFMNELEADKIIASVRMIRRTVPGI